jgi:hypothetical protein
LNLYIVDMDSGLRVFRRQYLQCLEPDFLAWPDPLLLKESDVQRWLYEQLFDTARISRLPPERYQFRVLKPLIARIERAIRDPEEDVGQHGGRGEASSWS